MLPGKVLGRVPPAPKKRPTIGSEPSFPGRPKEPGKQHQKGPGRPPAGVMEGLAPPAAAEPADDPLDENSWGAADPRIRAQLERELRGIREQLALRQQISAAKRELTASVPHSGMATNEVVRDGHLTASNAFSERELDALSVKSLDALAEAPVVDKEEARLQKRVERFEQLVVKKLIARTPRGGPSSEAGVGALKVLTKAFTYFDTERDGTVDLPTFTKILHDKFGAISQLPPPPAEKAVVAALFQKHARRHPLGELPYANFARELLHATNTLVPADEAMAEAKRQQWQYAVSVNQALCRRNLATSSATVPDPVPREAWADVSAAARAHEEAAAYQFQPRSGVILTAALRGRVPGGPAGLEQLKHMEAARAKALADERRAEYRLGREESEGARRRAAAAVHEAAAGWAEINRKNQDLRGMTPGEAAAAARRRA